MIGLEGHRPDMTDYHGCIDLIEKHVKRFSAEELEKLNAEKGQAGVTCLKWEEFKKTKHVSKHSQINHEELFVYISSGPDFAQGAALDHRDAGNFVSSSTLSRRQITGIKTANPVRDQGA